MSVLQIVLLCVGGIVLLGLYLWWDLKTGSYRWYIDSLKGDDMNPSNSYHFPLKTHEEFLRRLKLYNPIICRAHTIWIQGSYSRPMYLDVDIKRDGLEFGPEGKLRYITPRGIREVGPGDEGDQHGVG